MSNIRARVFAACSLSRFQHLFTQEVGVPFRRYRAWCRMRAAIAAVLHGNNLTDAAHAAGLSDQAHSSREFHRIFGAPAHRSLANARRQQNSRRSQRTEAS
jgi:AraC-like DNA-binding protein